MQEFNERFSQAQLNLNEQGLNVSLYWKNPDPRKFVNVVPTSAHTGEGIPDLLQLLVKLTQVGVAIHQQFMQFLLSCPLVQTHEMNANLSGHFLHPAIGLQRCILHLTVESGGLRVSSCLPHGMPTCTSVDVLLPC